LIDQVALDRVDTFVQEALQNKAKLVHGGHKLRDAEAPIYLPTVILDEEDTQLLNEDEIFGPVVTVRVVRTAAEAVRLTNETPYGLTASVWTADEGRAREIADQLQVGSVAVNDHLLPFFAANTPWGGVKASGLGSIGGAWGLEAMTSMKVISFDRITARREFYWFPTTSKVFGLIRHGLPTLYSTRFVKRLKGLLQLIQVFSQRS
jgi:acyl-CoA reductase-like NAD-dependent aldehyde dehydrogenase